MGTWGAGILDDDFARDVYDRYGDARESGQSDEQAIRHLREAFRADLEDPDYEPLFWLAIAHAQWDRERVTEEVMTRVQEIVTNGQGLSRWEEAGRAELTRRRKALARFAEQIRTPRARKRKAPAGVTPSPFTVGDCLAIELEDGRFGAAVVTAVQDTPTTSACILSIVRFHDSTAPEATEFAPPEWLPMTETPSITIVKYLCFSLGFRKHGARYRVVCRIDPGTVPPPLTLRLANWSKVWRDLGDVLATKITKTV